MPRGPGLRELKLTMREREQLLEWTRRHKSAQALALRSRIVLAAAGPWILPLFTQSHDAQGAAMVNLGTHKVEELEDEWTIVTMDHKLSAHFEHSIAITDGDAEILTK